MATAKKDLIVEVLAGWFEICKIHPIQIEFPEHLTKDERRKLREALELAEFYSLPPLMS